MTRKFHVACRALALEVKVNLDMERGNELGIRKLPNVQVMTRDDTVEIADVVGDVINRHVLRNSLEQDAGRGLAEGQGREKDDHGDEQRDGRISIHPP